MKIIEFKWEDYSNYKDFYLDIFKKLDGNSLDYFNKSKLQDLRYDADLLYEFLWYYGEYNLELVFIGFDLDFIKKDDSYNAHGWRLIFKAIREFIKDFPNNKISFVDKI